MTSTFDPTTLPGYCDRNAPANALIVLGAITFFVATVLISLRLYTRIVVVRAFWWDDLFLITAYLMIVPTLGLIWRSIHLGFGRHIGCYPVANVTTVLKYDLIAQTLDLVSTIFSRISVALFVGRLFMTTRAERVALFCFTVFMALTLGITTGLAWAYCTPTRSLWDWTILERKCWSTPALHFLWYFNGTVSVLSDFILALLPVPYIMKLNSSSSKKIILYCLLGLGFVPGICAIVRTVYVHVLISMDPLCEYKHPYINEPANHSIDDVSILGVFGILELTLLAICASIPALSPLFKSRRRSSVPANDPVWWLESPPPPPRKRHSIISEQSETTLFETGTFVQRVPIPSGCIRWSMRSDQFDHRQLSDIDSE